MHGVDIVMEALAPVLGPQKSADEAASAPQADAAGRAHQRRVTEWQHSRYATQCSCLAICAGACAGPPEEPRRSCLCSSGRHTRHAAPVHWRCIVCVCALCVFGGVYGGRGHLPGSALLWGLIICGRACAGGLVMLLSACLQLLQPDRDLVVSGMASCGHGPVSAPPALHSGMQRLCCQACM